MTATPYVLICSASQLIDEYWKGFGVGMVSALVLAALFIMVLSSITQSNIEKIEAERKK